MNEQLYQIASKILDIPVDRFHGSLSRETTTSWDSFNHLLLVSAIETEMGVKLTTAEIQSVKTMDDIENLIEQRR